MGDEEDQEDEGDRNSRDERDAARIVFHLSEKAELRESSIGRELAE